MRNRVCLSILALFWLQGATLQAIAERLPSVQLVENPQFDGPLTAAGHLQGWYRRTQEKGRVSLLQGDKGLRMELVQSGEDVIYAQTIKWPAGTVALDVSLTARWHIRPGKASWHEARFQGEWVDTGKKRINGYALISMRDHQPEYKTITRRFTIPKNAVALLIKVGIFHAHAGWLELRRLTVVPVSPKDLEEEHARYRPEAAYGLPVPLQRRKNFTRGVNINNWFCQPYNIRLNGKKGNFSAEWIRSYVNDKDLLDLSRTGIDHIRLPVDPSFLMDRDTPTTSKPAFQCLAEAVQKIRKANLSVIIDMHPKNSRFKGMIHNQELCRMYELWLARFASELSQAPWFDPDHIVLELLNEPGGQKFYGTSWQHYQDRLIFRIAKVAPSLTLITNAGGWQGVDETLKHVPHPYRNQMIAVHYYLPSQFTHQGARWMKRWYHPLRQVPWPLDEKNLPDAIRAIASSGDVGRYAPEARKALQYMVKQGLGTEQLLAEKFRLLREWANKHNIHVIIDEFGVYKKYAPVEARQRWLRAVRIHAEEAGFGWSVWDYVHDFGLAEGLPGNRRFDPNILDALGLQLPSSSPADDSILRSPR